MVQVRSLTGRVFEEVAIWVKVERLAFFDSFEMLFLAFSYRIILLGEFPANGKQSLSQPVVLS